MAESAFQLVSEIGTQLGRQTRSGKDSLLKSLKQAANALSEIEQPSTSEAARKLEAIKNLKVSTKPLRKAIVHGLLQHKDKEVRLLVAICISEIFRVMAPEPPFEDKYLRDIFKLIVSIFAELADTASPHFSRRVKILETIARCKCCVIMLDIDCNDLVLETFNTFFSVVRENHQRSLINHIISIMTHIINEEASQTLLDVILRKLVKDGKGVPCASYQLAVSIIQNCAEKLEPFICGFLTNCILDRDAVENELKEFYHEIIFQIFQCAPQMLLAVIPNLTHELLTDQVDVRIKAVNLVGKLFALPKRHVAQHYRDLFLEFLKRFSDKSVEVRVSTLQCVKAFYMASPSGTESHEVIISNLPMEDISVQQAAAPLPGSTVPDLPMEDISVQQAAAPLPSTSSTVPDLPIEEISVQQGESEINLVPHDGDSTQPQDSAPPATSRPLLFGNDRSQFLIKVQLFALSFIGGMVAGYCLQIGGGVLSMKESLKLFGVYRKMEFTKTTNYCSFDDDKLNSFIACLYLATAVSVLPSFVCSKLFGRRVVVCVGFGLALLGSILLTIKNLPTLFIGRIICGFGVGCILQVLPVYISESTPAEYADFLDSKFDRGFNFGGFVVASTVNFLVAMTKSGWRWSFGLSGVLALASLMLSATTPESPHYFIEMKDTERAKNAFRKTRGRLVVTEFDNLVAESEEVYSSLFHPFGLQYMPYLFIACVREVFMQMTGMFAINFFTPIFLTSIGVSASTSFISSMGVGYTYFIMAILGGMLVDQYKRRVMLRSSASVMIFTLFMIFGLLRLSNYDVMYFEVDVAVAISMAMFFYVCGYAVISGPRGWFSVPLPRRAKGMGSALTMTISMLFVSLMAYISAPVVCVYKEYTVLVFGLYAVAMETFICFLVPETRDISEEEMNVKAWRQHRIWKKCIR